MPGTPLMVFSRELPRLLGNKSSAFVRVFSGYGTAMSNIGYWVMGKTNMDNTPNNTKKYGYDQR
jgi:hypothetical protein